jgi:alanine racemase
MKQSHLTINLEAITHNFRALECAAHPAKLIPVVKADAYGVGATAMSQHLVSIGAKDLLVAFLHEATDLQEAGVSATFFVQHLSARQVPRAVQADVHVTVWSEALLDALEHEAGLHDKVVPCHLMLDTGMHREGALWDDALRLALKLHEAKHLQFFGLMSHLAVADENPSDAPHTATAIVSFERFLSVLTAAGIPLPPARHIANSDAIGRHIATNQTRVRTGIALYGYSCAASQAALGLRHALRLTTTVLETRTLPAGASVGYGLTTTTSRETRVALLPVGYADGYSRTLSNKGSVSVHGTPCPILGRVSMDLLTIDISDVPSVVNVGDEAVLFGPGPSDPCLLELARLANTIPYEIMTNVSQRVLRIYSTTEE